MFRNGTDIGVDSREPVVIVVYIKASIFGNDHTAAEYVHADPRIAIAHFHRIESSADVVPWVHTYKPFFSVTQLLPPNFQREWDFGITNRDKCLVQVDRIRFRPGTTS